LLRRLIAAADLLTVLDIGGYGDTAAAAPHVDILPRGDLAERNRHHPGQHDRE
jgi:hypothetical protein